MIITFNMPVNWFLVFSQDKESAQIRSKRCFFFNFYFFNLVMNFGLLFFYIPRIFLFSDEFSFLDE